MSETICSAVEIPVPSQTKLHKQWCLFDQGDGDIDFDTEVRNIKSRQEDELERQEGELEGQEGELERHIVEIKSQEKEVERQEENLVEDQR